MKGRSTALQLTCLVDYIANSFDAGQQVDIIHIDFEKTFDKLPHNLLLYKLRCCGFSSSLIAWIENFLLYVLIMFYRHLNLF